MNLPKYGQTSNSVINSLININDMIKSGSTLKAVKEQAKIKGFNAIAKSRSFGAARSAIKEELNTAGLISV